MPTTDDILNQDTAALTELETEQVRAICGLKTYTEASTLTTSLLSSQYQTIRALIAAWDSIGDGTVALNGGNEGVDYSQSRDKEEIRVQMRLLLGLEAFDPALDPRAGYLVQVQSPWYGSNDDDGF